MEKQKTPRGIRNNNPLNIRKGNDWQGERHPQVDPAFEEFESMEMGLRAGFKVLQSYVKKRIDTPSAIIARWAPSDENNTKAYLDYVCKRARLNPHEKLKFTPSGVDKNKICCMVWAMVEMETGVTISFQQIENAYAIAMRK